MKNPRKPRNYMVCGVKLTIFTGGKITCVGMITNIIGVDAFLEIKTKKFEPSRNLAIMET